MRSNREHKADLPPGAVLAPYETFGTLVRFDRVRGEGMHAWGVPEAKAFGLYELLRTTCGQEVRWWDIYLGSQQIAHRRFQTTVDIPRLIEESLRTGAAADLYAHARAVGSLASFGSDDFWVEHPYKASVALVGDAASTCDPSFGQGLAMTLRSVPLLRDHLLKTEDWEAAGHAYAEEQHRHF